MKIIFAVKLSPILLFLIYCFQFLTMFDLETFIRNKVKESCNVPELVKPAMIHNLLIWSEKMEINFAKMIILKLLEANIVLHMNRLDFDNHAEELFQQFGQAKFFRLSSAQDSKSLGALTITMLLPEGTFSVRYYMHKDPDGQYRWKYLEGTNPAFPVGSFTLEELIEKAKPANYLNGESFNSARALFAMFKEPDPGTTGEQLPDEGIYHRQINSS